MVGIDLDPSRRLVLSLVLEAEHAAVVINVVLGDAAPQEFDHLILKMSYLLNKPLGRFQIDRGPILPIFDFFVFQIFVV